MQRYLQYDTLQAKGMGHFDSWSSTFAETVTAVELAPQGTGYKARTRFAKFQNLPDGICFRGCLKSNTTKTYDNRPSVAILARLLRYITVERASAYDELYPNADVCFAKHHFIRPTRCRTIKPFWHDEEKIPQIQLSGALWQNACA